MRNIFLKAIMLLLTLVLCIGLSSCVKMEVKIIFMNGETVCSAVSTNGNQAVTIPKNPEKDGFKFDGWYLDENVWNEPFTANSILNMPISDNMELIVYAKFDCLHTNTYINMVIEPTCIVDGYTIYNCSCGYEYIGNETPALGHDLTKYEYVTPTCINEGNFEYQKCSRCEYTTFESISATGHTDGEWITDTKPTCTEDGNKHQVCAVCDATIATESISATGHNYALTITPPTKVDDGWTNNICLKCNNEYIDNIVPATGSLGILYEINSDGKTCSVAGIGTCEDTEIIIPKQYENYTVTAIKDMAFANCNNITSFILPETIQQIGFRAFYCCSRITELTIPKSVYSIGKQILLGCSSLSTVYYNSNFSPIEGETPFNVESLSKIVFGDNLKEIPSYICYSCDNIKEVVIPEGITSIGAYTFAECSNLKSIELPSTLQYTGWYAFKDSGLEYVVIPNSVTRVENSFRGCVFDYIVLPTSVVAIPGQSFYVCNIGKIFYEGNYIDRQGVNISDSSQSLNRADWYYYSENEPSDLGYNYWHYVDGKIVIWE